jgi:hypothetical protein
MCSSGSIPFRFDARAPKASRDRADHPVPPLFFQQDSHLYQNVTNPVDTANLETSGDRLMIVVRVLLRFIRPNQKENRFLPSCLPKPADSLAISVLHLADEVSG